MTAADCALPCYGPVLFNTWGILTLQSIRRANVWKPHASNTAQRTSLPLTRAAVAGVGMPHETQRRRSSVARRHVEEPHRDKGGLRSQTEDDGEQGQSSGAS